jgi:COMPASS component SWD3
MSRPALASGNSDGDAVAFSPDGQILALTSSFDQTKNPFRNTIQLWDVQTGQQLSTLTGHTDRITGILFAPMGEPLSRLRKMARFGYGAFLDADLGSLGQRM